MTDLNTVLANECTAMSNEEALTHIKSKTLIIDGVAQSGYVLSYIASIGKLSTFRALSADAESPFRDAADAAIVTLESREGFDFRNAGTAGLMAAFVVGGVLTQTEANTIQAIGQKTVSEFPGVKMVDIVKITGVK